MGKIIINNYIIILGLITLSYFISVSYAGAGDPNANGLPITCERQLQTLFNAYRADPIFWGKNYFQGLIVASSSKYKPITPLPYIDGFDQSAHDHAAQMASVQWSPINCTDTLPLPCSNSSDPNPICQPPNVCCLRDPDCANVSLDSLHRLPYYGWTHIALPYAAGGAVARGAQDALTALLSILCDYFGSVVPSTCVPDASTTIRQLLLSANGNGQIFKFFNAGFGYANADPTVVKQPPYWAMTFATNSASGPATWTNFLTSGVYAPWFFRGNSSIQTGSGAFIATYSDGSSTNGPNQGQLYVVISGTKYQMVKVNNNNQVWLYNGTAGSVDYSNFAVVTAGPATNYYFMFLQGSSVMRYPASGYLIIGASTADYAVDPATCGSCNPGTCYNGNCVCLTANTGSGCTARSPASTAVISFVILLISACIALL